MLKAFKEKWAGMDKREKKKTITVMIVLVLFYAGLLWFLAKYPPQIVDVQKSAIEQNY